MRGVRRTSITVVLAGFEDLVARGLRALIDEDHNIELVAVDTSGSEIPRLLATRRPHVAVLNYGSLRSIAEVRRLHENHENTRLVVLANNPTPAESRQMLAFGATACLAKSTEARDIINAIHLASRGLRVLPAATPAEDSPSGPELLTPREADVLDQIQTGRSNAEIAQTLHVSVETVRTHARRIYRKLGVKTRRELRARR
jgi:DNA-binding NarL/FixJ family response regulator